MEDDERHNFFVQVQIFECTYIFSLCGGVEVSKGFLVIKTATDQCLHIVAASLFLSERKLRELRSRIAEYPKIWVTNNTNILYEYNERKTTILRTRSRALELNIVVSQSLDYTFLYYLNIYLLCLLKDLGFVKF